MESINKINESNIENGGAQPRDEAPPKVVSEEEIVTAAKEDELAPVLIVDDTPFNIEALQQIL